MNTRRNRLVALTLIALGAPALAAPAEATDPAAWAPADALAFIGVDDVAKLTAQIKRSNFYKLMHDPDLKDLPGQASIPQKFTEEFRKRLAGSLDIKPDKLHNPFAGPLVAYLVRSPESENEDIEGVVVAGIGNTALMKEYYQKATRKFRAAADNHEKIDFHDYTIDVFTTESRADDENGDEEDEQDTPALDPTTPEENLTAMMDEVFGKLFSAESMPEKLALCLTEDRLIVAPAPRMIKAVLRRKVGEGRTLLETDNYKALLHAFKPLGSIRFLVNLGMFMDMMESEDGEKAKQTINLLGLRSMRAVIGHLEYGAKAYESKLEAELLMSGPRTGLARILSMKNTPLAPPSLASADDFMYWRFNLDIAGLVDEIERMVRQDDPDAADEFHQTLESVPFGEGQTLNLRKEVFANLRPPLVLTVGFKQPYGPESPRFLFSLGVKDKDAMDRFLARLGEVAAGMLVERETRGVVVYDASFGGFSLTANNDAVILGTTAAVDRALQPGRKSENLATRAAFRKLTELAPAEAWGVVYIDSRRMYEGALELARNKDALMAAQFSNPAAMMTAQLVESLTAGIKPDEIDRAKALLKYQASTILTIATTPDGLRLTNIQLRPAAGE